MKNDKAHVMEYLVHNTNVFDKGDLEKPDKMPVDMLCYGIENMIQEYLILIKSFDNEIDQSYAIIQADNFRMYANEILTKRRIEILNEMSEINMDLIPEDILEQIEGKYDVFEGENGERYAQKEWLDSQLSTEEAENLKYNIIARMTYAFPKMKKNMTFINQYLKNEKYQLAEKQLPVRNRYALLFDSYNMIEDAQDMVDFYFQQTEDAPLVFTYDRDILQKHHLSLFHEFTQYLREDNILYYIAQNIIDADYILPNILVKTPILPENKKKRIYVGRRMFGYYHYLSSIRNLYNDRLLKLLQSPFYDYFYFKTMDYDQFANLEPVINILIDYFHRQEETQVTIKDINQVLKQFILDNKLKECTGLSKKQENVYYDILEYRQMLDCQLHPEKYNTQEALDKTIKELQELQETSNDIM